MHKTHSLILKITITSIGVGFGICVGFWMTAGAIMNAYLYVMTTEGYLTEICNVYQADSIRVNQ